MKTPTKPKDYDERYDLSHLSCNEATLNIEGNEDQEIRQDELRRDNDILSYIY